MAEDGRIVVVLPAYNEEAGLGELLRRIASQGATVIVVDDGSRDGTAEVARAAAAADPRVSLIRHERNLGLGAALRTGIRAALQLAPGCEVTVTMDADGTHDPDLIPELAEHVRRGADVVIASRFAPGGGEVGLGWDRRLLSRGAGLFMRTLFPIAGVRDYSSGYRAYRAAFLRRAIAAYGEDGLITADGFDCMAEILVKARPLGPRCREVPLVLRYDRKRGRSKMRVLPTVLGYLRLARAAWSGPPGPGPRSEPGRGRDPA